LKVLRTAKVHNDVVVTGLGVVAPNGIGIERFWRNTLAGYVATGPLTRFATHGLQTTVGGEVNDFDAREYFHQSDACRHSLSCKLAVAAARLCLQDGAAEGVITGSERAGVCFGSVSGSRPGSEEFRPAGPPGSSRDESTIPIPCQLSRAVAEELSLFGPNVTITTACAAGNSAISWAADAIRSGRADIMIAGGADQLSYGMLGLFSRLRALSKDVVRPFDRNRTGLLLSEGAGALLLESREHAVRRSARIYCRVAGYANCADAYHMTAPDPTGRGALRAMAAALKMAGVTPAEVGFVSAHGTGTRNNDASEAKALNSLFAESDPPPVSSLKSQIGHTQGAASAIEAVACIMTLATGMIHATANLTDLDPECDIHVVTEPRRLQKEVALNNAFGFGGNISCVVFSA
jgi:3-oxoacyl-(acyl-carrier-protein) synthase